MTEQTGEKAATAASRVLGGGDEILMIYDEFLTEAKISTLDPASIKFRQIISRFIQDAKSAAASALTQVDRG